MSTAAHPAPPSAAATLIDRPVRLDEPAAKGCFGLDPGLTFLNHGSYGACLDEVLDAQHAYRVRMERDPVRFFKVDLEHLLDGVRERLADFVNCRPADLAPVGNATIALCTILQSYAWRPGDEVLVTSHEYSSGTNELERMASSTGLRVVTADIPFPVPGPEVVVDALLGRVTDRTRLVIVSHITSATSLIFPVERIVDALRARGIDVVVDGAHTPGQIPVDIRALNPTYYVGSLHKWGSAPKGTGFIWVHPERQQGFRTIALSSRAKKVRPERALYLRDFDYMGTNDYTPLLAVPHAIDAMARLVPGGWPAIMQRNRDLALRAKEIVSRSAGLVPGGPDSMTGSMVSFVLPEPDPGLPARATIYDDPLQDALVDRHRIQVPVWRLGENPGTRLLRVSAQVYNFEAQYHLLGGALATELLRERSA